MKAPVFSLGDWEMPHEPFLIESHLVYIVFSWYNGHIIHSMIGGKKMFGDRSRI